MYISRIIEPEVEFSLKHFPVTAITGPRQCGKTTLAKHVISGRANTVILDLEKPGDMAKLSDPQLYFNTVKSDLICIDEVQRMPELFPLIRALTDEWGRAGAFLVLGSASRDLLRQSSETLAGRISYKRMSPFALDEYGKAGFAEYLTKGGFPRSLFEKDEKVSYMWRDDFIQTFLERDLLQWSSFTPATMQRLWRMLAHMNGQTVNYSALASSLDITAVTVKKYIDLLNSTYMVEVIPPWFSNLGKRLIRAPKIYVADTGIIACLLGLKTYDDIVSHPVAGSLWEQAVLAIIRVHNPAAEVCHYRTSNGSEVDFVIRAGQELIAVECKLSQSPALSKGNYNAIEDIAPLRTLVVCPVDSGWPIASGIDVVSPQEFARAVKF